MSYDLAVQDGSATAGELMRAAVYRRTIRASLARAWENVLDWEHLPWLHSDSFSDIERVDSGSWGWRARVGLQPAKLRQQILLELRVERPKGRYVARTLEGPGAGTEIWTRLEPEEEHRTRVEVEFLMPGLSAEQAPAVGAAYTRVYTQLWDEDEAMMVRREALLSRRRGGQRAAGDTVAMGTLDEVRTRLPLCVEVGGRSFRVLELDGELLAHSTVCPHQLGPLEQAEVEDGCIRCPWHGYRFDLRSGRHRDGTRLRLDAAPRVAVDVDGARVQLIWENADAPTRS